MLDPDWPEALRAAAAAALDAADLADGSLVLFTSGSSGRPRGVVRTTASWQASVEPLSRVSGIGPADVVWLPGSATSTLTLYGGWHATAVGAQVRATPRWPAEPPPPETTALHATPRVLAAALSAAERGGLSRMRVAVVAGAALPDPLRARAHALGWHLVDYYGAAELSFVAWRAGAAAAYQPFPGVDVEVRAGDLGVGEMGTGEIWARSAYLAEGYLEPGDAGPLRRDGAWATVGDLGRPEGGGLTVLGRGDAAVTTGGRTVVVEEVESVVRAGAEVDDVVVSSIPHPLLGELLVAVVALADPTRAETLSRDRLDAACSGLPEWSRPRRWWVVGDLPRAASGKPDRAAARAGVADGSLTARPLR